MTLLFTSALVHLAFAAPLAPSDVPSPRPGGSWVADPAGVLDDAQTARIDATVDALQAQLGAEVAVVAVDEVQGTPKDFAHDLFNLWGVGDASANNGVVVLLVVGARRVEIETGYGVEGILTDGWVGRMMDESMVPAFRAGQLGEGLVAGVQAVDERLRLYPEETRLGTDEDVAEKIDPRTVAKGAAGGAGALALGGGVWFYRRRRRQCPVCKQTMEQLSEEDDDQHLEPGQQAEEGLGSMDYEVRICVEHEQIKVIPHRRLTRHKKCSKCGYRTARKVSKTLVAASYTSGGRVRVTETCGHCGHHSSRTYNTARLTPPSSNNSSSSSGGSYSSGGSSGGSFGGGSSGGGGAGRSW